MEKKSIGGRGDPEQKGRGGGQTFQEKLISRKERKV